MYESNKLINLGDFTFNGYAYCVIKPDKMSTCKVCNKRRTRSLCLGDATNICMKCKDIFNSGNYEVTITDDAEVLHESLISENQLYSPPVHCKKDPPTTINDNSLPSISSTIDCTLNTQDNFKRRSLGCIILASYSKKYDNFIIMGDFNLEPTDEQIKILLPCYNLYNLVKENTCFKGPPPPPPSKYML